MSDLADRQIVISRIVDAPRDLVWRAWTEPEHLEQWWGPNGFTVTTKSIDVREGGSWRFTMHGPDGTDWPNLIVFTKIVKHELIAHDHGADDGAVQFRATITFEDMAGKTKIVMTSTFPTAEEKRRVIEEVGAIEGGKQTLGRCAEHVSRM